MKTPFSINTFYTIDIGNSHTKIFSSTSSSLIKLISLEELNKKATPNDVIIFSSVLSKKKCFALNPVLAKLLYSEILSTEIIYGKNFHPQIIDSAKYRIENDYLGMKTSYGQTLGIDRLVQARLVFEELNHQKNSIKKCLLIDAGTMVTFDIVTVLDGHHGGIIAPGLKTYAICFAKGDQLPETQKILLRLESYDSKNSLHIPNSTETAVTSSYWSSLLAYLSIFVQKWGIEKIVLTGGHGELWLKQIKNSFELNEFSHLQKCNFDLRPHFIHESLHWLGNKVLLGQVK